VSSLPTVDQWLAGIAATNGMLAMAPVVSGVEAPLPHTVT
jgi:hypothetical protein